MLYAFFVTCIYHILFTQTPTDGHLGSLQFLNSTNKPDAINSSLYESMWELSQGVHIGENQTALLNGFASLHPHQEGRRVPSSMPLGICLLSYCAAVLMDRWQLTASLCISLDRKVSELCFQSQSYSGFSLSEASVHGLYFFVCIFPLGSLLILMLSVPLQASCSPPSSWGYLTPAFQDSPGSAWTSLPPRGSAQAPWNPCYPSRVHSSSPLYSPASCLSLYPNCLFESQLPYRDAGSLRL